jgi:hypothetical protein
MNHTLQKSGQNLLPNGTFASGISSGWTTGDPAYVMADSTNNGSYPSPVDSVKLSGNTSTSSLSSPAVHATATSIYGFQAFINSNTLSSGHVAYYANEYDATGNQISQTLLGSVSSQQVKYFTALYQPSSSRVDSFRIQTTVSAGGRGTAYVDDYELYDLGQMQPAANLVANGRVGYLARSCRQPSGKPKGRAFLLKTSEKKRQGIPVGPRHMAQFRCHRLSARLYVLEPAGALT